MVYSGQVCFTYFLRLQLPHPDEGMLDLSIINKKYRLRRQTLHQSARPLDGPPVAFSSFAQGQAVWPACHHGLLSPGFAALPGNRWQASAAGAAAEHGGEGQQAANSTCE